MVEVPRIERLPDDGLCVTRWGRVGDLLVRAGDRLIVGPDSSSDLLVLVPRGRGRPMLGRYGKRGLIAEPGGVPASIRRWQVLGTLVAVERNLERSGVGASGGYVGVRIDGDDIAAISRARSSFVGGWMSELAIAELCNRAAVAPERFGVSVALAQASDPETANGMVGAVPAGRIRCHVQSAGDEREGHGVVVPGPWLKATEQQQLKELPQASGTVQLGLFGRARQTG